MKFGQLIEYNMRNIFLENHTQDVVEKLSPDPLLKNENWAYLLINYLKFYTVCFYHMPSWGYQNMLRLSSKPLAITSYKAFLKNKEVWNLSPCLNFCMVFEEKHFYCYILLPDYRLSAFTSWDIGQYYCCNCLLTRLRRHKFWH